MICSINHKFNVIMKILNYYLKYDNEKRKNVFPTITNIMLFVSSLVPTYIQMACIL